MTIAGIETTRASSGVLILNLMGNPIIKHCALVCWAMQSSNGALSPMPGPERTQASYL